MKTPEVSVCVPTYFHEKYIRQALDSILSQKVLFDYEICVSDDCSQDGTAEILREYAEKYNFIRLQINEANLGLTANIFANLCMAEGKYIVFLAGDDYYIDDRKLQKQYDFLETHPDYFGVCTCIEIRADGIETIGYAPAKKYRNREFTLPMFLKGEDYPLSGMMIRNCLKDKADYEFFSIMPKVSKYVDDLTDCILYLMKGGIFILSDCCTAYRLRVAEKDAHNYGSLQSDLSNYHKHMELLDNLYEALHGEVDLFYRYEKILVQFWPRSYLKKKHAEYKSDLKTVPEVYIKRHLYARSVVKALATLPARAVRKVRNKVTMRRVRIKKRGLRKRRGGNCSGH